MASFKVGQRVKVIRCDNYPEFVGFETVVIALPPCNPWAPDEYQVGSPPGHGGNWSAPPDYLAPLTDPGAGQFVASLERLGREPSPAHTKEAA